MIIVCLHAHRIDFLRILREDSLPTGSHAYHACPRASIIVPVDRKEKGNWLSALVFVCARSRSLPLPSHVLLYYAAGPPPGVRSGKRGLTTVVCTAQLIIARSPSAVAAVVSGRLDRVAKRTKRQLPVIRTSAELCHYKVLQ